MSSLELQRILDANLNRAREGLRVIEDYLRFARDDAELVARTKALRHQVREISTLLGPALPSARSVEHDVGRDRKTASELTRASLSDVLRAEFARVEEAARSLSEYGKLVSAEAARAAEAVRYQCYLLEQAVLLRLDVRARFRAVRLYVIVTEALCRWPWLDVAQAAIDGGAGCIQLREKSLPDGELLRRAEALRRLTAARGALFVMNDRPDVAKLVGADGVHVGQDDLPVRAARRIAGADLLIGKSTHTPEQLDAALGENPDYIAVGPMFASTTKPQEHIAGPEMLRAAAVRTKIPLVAIGGITSTRATELFQAGASCVCVCSAVISSDDPETEARRIAAAEASVAT